LVIAHLKAHLNAVNSENATLRQDRRALQDKLLKCVDYMNEFTATASNDSLQDHVLMISSSP
jgi:hypothetical protein